MRFSRAASYNNPHEMFPSASKLFSGMNSVAGNVTSVSNHGTPQRSPRILTKLKEEDQSAQEGEHPTRASNVNGGVQQEKEE